MSSGDSEKIDKLDVIIFGASGFTGKYAVFEAISVLENLRWGIAGRNRAKLAEILTEVGVKANKNLANTPIVIADVNDQNSLLDMARRARVIVNLCGPYRFYGEPVVRACIEAGTHHVDISGEAQYMESMQLKYNAQAQEHNVYIVSACGFDSIPADMGTIFVQQNFDGIVNSVEMYVKVGVKGGRNGAALLNYGTWESAVYALAHENELHDIRAQLFTEKLPKLQPVLKSRLISCRSEIVNGISLPFSSPDKEVVWRSQRFLYEQERRRPLQLQTYVVLDGCLTVILFALAGLAVTVLTRFSFGRRLLLKYPKQFSFGAISHEGPTVKTVENTHFSLTMKALGWPKTESVADPSDRFKNPPTKSLTVKISGTNPGYGATCVSVLSAAVTILKESDKMPGTGGVLPPGAAFAKTSLIDLLGKHEHGVKFEVLTTT